MILTEEQAKTEYRRDAIRVTDDRGVMYKLHFGNIWERRLSSGEWVETNGIHIPADVLHAAANEIRRLDAEFAAREAADQAGKP